MKLFKKNIAIGLTAATIAVSVNAFAATTINYQDDENISLSGVNYEYTGSEMIELSEIYATYNGKQIKPSPVITYDGEPLEEGTDYELTYGENINAGEGYIYVHYIGNYTDNMTITFTIHPRELSNSLITVSDINNQTYTRNEIKPEPTVTYKSKTLVKGTDYDLDYEENTNVGTATVNIDFKGNYDGIATTTFNIVSKTLTQDDVTFSDIDDITFTGSEIKPEPTIVYDGTTLIKDTDYELSYERNTNVGTATVKATFKNNYSGEASITFDIVQKSLSNDTITISDIPNQTFTGSEIKPEPIIKYGETTLIKNTDYKLNYSGNTNVGEGTVDITFIGNYTGTGSKTFTIDSWELQSGDYTITTIPDQVYTGNVIEPNVEIKVGNTTLIKGTDYNVTFDDNTDKGTATANIEFIGNYSGDTSTTFEIITLTLSNDNLTIGDIEDYTYDRHEYKPEPEIKLGNTVLVKDRDYTLDYENNINAGVNTGLLKVTGIGNFDGEGSKTFTIKPRNGSLFTYYLIYFDDENDE